MLSSATAPEMDIIIDRQTNENTREHVCNSKKPSPSTPKPNALVVRTLNSANNSTNNCICKGNVDQAVYKEYDVRHTCTFYEFLSIYNGGFVVEICPKSWFSLP
eukprot:scaffold12995_cov61-Cyclotella_meneghiniana.AAC.1